MWWQGKTRLNPNPTLTQDIADDPSPHSLGETMFLFLGLLCFCFVDSFDFLVIYCYLYFIFILYFWFVSGRQYDGNGNAQPWWSESTIEAFTKQVKLKK